MSLSCVGCDWLRYCPVVVVLGCPWYVVGWPRRSGRRAGTLCCLGSHAVVLATDDWIGGLSKDCLVAAVVVVVHWSIDRGGFFIECCC